MSVAAKIPIRFGGALCPLAEPSDAAIGAASASGACQAHAGSACGFSPALSPALLTMLGVPSSLHELQNDRRWEHVQVAAMIRRTG